MTSTTTMTTNTTNMNDSYQYVQSLNDIQTIRDLTEEGIRDILRKFTADHTLTVTHYGNLEDMSGLNDAFNSTICSMRVETVRGENVRETFNFVIKSPPKMSFLRQVHKLTQPFYNEVSWYMELIQQLELANGKGCIDHILPKCYHAYSSSYAASSSDVTGVCETRCPWFCYVPCKRAEDGILILENIKLRQGLSYTMYDKKKPLPLDHMELIVKELAHFHGKWLKWKRLAQKNKLEQQRALSWKTFEATYNTQKRIPSALYKQLSKVAKKTTINILKQKGDEDENIEKCRKFFNHTAIEWLKNYMTRPDNPINTLCHGDFWSNNILFSYDDAGKVTGLNIIDYQLINYGHPCYDLVYIMYINTDLEFRDSHLRDILRLYYDHFSPYIFEDNEDQVSYSFEEFISDYNWHRSVGFTTACSVMPNVLSSKPVDLEASGIMALRELQQKQEREMNDDNNPSTVEIRRRIVDMVHEMARDGVI